MIIKDIKIILQNVWKNNSIVNMILETCFPFNIIFIQELSWTTICSIPNLKSREGEALVSIPNHPNWLNFVSYMSNANDYPRVIIYCYNWCLLDATWTRVKDNDDMIGCNIIVSVSTSCNRYYILALSSLFDNLFSSCKTDYFLMATMYI